jgi:predicted alpha/beta-hydrolase family hydrolase
VESAVDTPEVRGVLHEPEEAPALAVALTHGAGSDHTSPLLVRLAENLAAAGCLVLRYDLPFRRERRGGAMSPAAQARDREGIARAIAFLRRQPGDRLLAGGHSYGGRQTAMAAAEYPKIADALLLLSYPLHPPKKPEQKRTSYFPNLRTPALFVHGTKDPFGSIEELRGEIVTIPSHTDVLVVEGAAHDLKRAADLSSDILNRLRTLLCYPD